MSGSQLLQDLRDEIRRDRTEDLASLEAQFAKLERAIMGDGNGTPGLIRRVDRIQRDQETMFTLLKMLVLPLVVSTSVGVASFLWMVASGQIKVIPAQ